ncbi:hypothetical protein [Brevibacillus formosus]|uniref:hypothetical protein n=2 Tax=Brevibacillus formosus TaxID=54913 RepID=UPI003F530991
MTRGLRNNIDLKVGEDMEVKLTREEIELAIKIHIFSKTGMRVGEDTAVNFVKDGNSTRVDSVSVQI